MAFQKQTNNEGFTLIELLMVISIITFLASILLVSVVGVRRKARDVKSISEIQVIKNALDLYYEDNGYFPRIGTSTPPAIYVTIIYHNGTITSYDGFSSTSGSWKQTLGAYLSPYLAGAPKPASALNGFEGKYGIIIMSGPQALEHTNFMGDGYGNCRYVVNGYYIYTGLEDPSNYIKMTQYGGLWNGIYDVWGGNVYISHVEGGLCK